MRLWSLHPKYLDRQGLLAAWREALLAEPAVKASTVSNIEAVWQENLIVRKRWLGTFVSKDVIGAALVE